MKACCLQSLKSTLIQEVFTKDCGTGDDDDDNDNDGW